MRWRAGCGNLRHRVNRQEILGLDPYTVAGFVGVACIVTAYFANQQGSLNSEDWRFPAANLVGSLLILASLWTAWNFPSVVIEVIWAAISLYGLSRRLQRR
jgi:drug/metabolite transporter (DMT)-like permease